MDGENQGKIQSSENILDSPEYMDNIAAPAFLSGSHLRGVRAHENNVTEETAQPSASSPTRMETTTNVTDGDLYIPGLTSSSLFVIIPETNNLTALVAKYIPPEVRPKRDREWRGKTVEELVSKRSWRGVAEACQEAIMNSSTDETTFILQHWVLRLYALIQLGLVDHFGTELTALFGVLPPSAYFDIGTSMTGHVYPMFHPVIPFELHVFLACLPGLRGDKEKSVESLGILLRAAKCEMWAEKNAGNVRGADLWRQRADSLGRIMTNSLIELKAFSSVSDLLHSATLSSTSRADTQISLCRLGLSMGLLEQFEKYSSALQTPIDNDSGNTVNSKSVKKVAALGLVARGEWKEAEQEWRTLVEKDPQDFEALNNLAVILLFNQKLPEAIKVITSLLTKAPLLGYSSETILFNLATLLELRTDAAQGAKVRLLGGVMQHGGDGVNVKCLKLPM